MEGKRQKKTSLHTYTTEKMTMKRVNKNKKQFHLNIM